MSIVVEHEIRRRKILERAVDVFVDEGFENTTFQKIADRCKITRTTLYLYFHNKREIFNYSIKQLLNKVEGDLSGVLKNSRLSHAEKLKRTLSMILDRLEENRRLLSVILDYLLCLSKSSDTAESRVRRRTIRLRHILAGVLIEGIKAGEIKKIDVHAADDLFYGIIETAIFRLTVFKRQSVEELKGTVEFAVRKLCGP
ncbi:MAG: TetR/AcrR family transcriptional regulator [Treponema sp.]|jgi:AcrR family transcriptional regulator|nr:TetR/AcrR family transcriptional regulator [Treponema sp.]